MISSGLTEAVWFEVDEMPPVFLMTAVILPLAVLGFAVDFAIVESNPSCFRLPVDSDEPAVSLPAHPGGTQ
jgi:hypothetical protein